jgi:hypothetical protein
VSPNAQPSHRPQGWALMSDAQAARIRAPTARGYTVHFGRVGLTVFRFGGLHE